MMGWLAARLNPDGRTSRVGYWRGQVALALCMALVTLATVLTIKAGGPGAAVFALAVPLLIASVLVSIRRMHDRDRSGWWCVLFTATPFLFYAPGTVLAETRSAGAVLAALALYVGGFSITGWAYLEFGFFRGTRGPNRFGPEPRPR